MECFAVEAVAIAFGACATAYELSAPFLGLIAGIVVLLHLDVFYYAVESAEEIKAGNGGVG